MLFSNSSCVLLWKKWERENNNWLVLGQNIVPLPTDRLRHKFLINFLYSLELPFEDVNWICDPNRKELKSSLVSEGSLITFYFHPRSIDLASIISPHSIVSHEVEPTSSPRSFFLGNQIIKTNLPPEIGDYYEKLLTWCQIQRMIYISTYLSQKCLPNEHYGFLRESFGCSFDHGDKQLGYVIREIPDEVLLNKSHLISLVSYVSFSSKGEPSLFQTHLSFLSPKEEFLFLSRLVRSIIQGFLYLYWDSGVSVEAHQQNTLLELDPEMKVTGKVFFRDLEGARIDINRNRISELKMYSSDKLEDIEAVFEMKKVSGLLSSAPTTQAHNFSNWDGLVSFAYHAFIEGSCLTLIENAYDELWKGRRKINFKKLGLKILQESLIKKRSGERVQSLGGN